MRIELPVDDEDAPQLCGLIAARPAFTSVPGTRAWFLRRKGLGLPISVAGEAGRPGCSKRPSARVSVGRHEWSAAVTVRATSIGDDRAIVAAAGVIIPRPDTMVPAAQTRFELAAEFLRCA
jgi:hypothetical protein